MGVGGRFARRGPSLRSDVRAIIDSVSGFSSVSCLETWRIPVPRIRDWLHRIEPRSPNSRPGVETGRIEPRSPDGRPGGHIRSGWSVSRFGPSDTLVGVRPAHWPVPHVCGMVPVELAAASPHAGLPLQAGWPLPLRRSIPGRYRLSSRVSLRLSPGRPVVDLEAGRFSPTS